MAFTDTPHTHFIQTVQTPFVVVKVGGMSTTDVTKRAFDEVQGLLKAKFPELVISIDIAGDSTEEGASTPCAPAVGQQDIPNHTTHYSSQDDNLFSGNQDLEMPALPPGESCPQLPNEEIVQAPDSLISQLNSRVNDLTNKNGDLKRVLDLAYHEMTEVTSKLSTVTQERDDLRQQRKINLQKIKRLNELIIKSSQNSDEPLDSEILQEMFKVRNMTTDIIRRFYPGDAGIKSEVVKSLTKQLKDPFYAQFYRERLFVDKNSERRRRLLISLLFGELRHLFFGPNARPYGLPREIETSFQDIERRLEASSEVNADDTLDWRARTVSYVGRLALTGRQEVIDAYAKRIRHILEPMVLLGEDNFGNVDKREDAGLSNALQDLCSVALKLALQFRSSKTQYQFEAYPDDKCLAMCNSSWVKMTNAQGSISSPTDPKKLHIFCTLFGALVKTSFSTSGEPQDPIVLEAGHVIVYEPQQRDLLQ